MNDISIDLETLSTRHDAAVLSIGAAAFDRTTGEIGDKLYVEVDVDSAIANGHVLGSTLGWWMQQNEKAKTLFNAREKQHLANALQMLAIFVGDHKGARVWGNGATFDITILEQAYSRLGLTAPWEFYNVRDMRTIVDAAKERGFDRDSVPFEGVKHNAIDDAYHQARMIAACWATIVSPPASTEQIKSWHTGLPLPGADAHSDDIAVDAFTAAMKTKMAKQRAKGYGGWDDPAQCTDQSLADKLMAHTKKGDPVDVANFAMMIHQRNAGSVDLGKCALRIAALDFAKRVASMWIPEPSAAPCDSDERAAFFKEYELPEGVRIDQGHYAEIWDAWKRRAALAASPVAVLQVVAQDEKPKPEHIEFWSADEEDFNSTALGELIDRNEQLKPGDVVQVGEAMQPSASQLCDAEDVIEILRDRSSDIAGEFAEGYPDVSIGDASELQSLLNGWINKRCPPYFYAVRNVKPYTLTEADFEGIDVAIPAAQGAATSNEGAK